MLILTIDTGTTNTRCCIWHGDTIKAEASAEVGVRDTAITGNLDALKKGLSRAIAEALSNARANAADIELVLASGMITSNLGLHELAHVPAPAGIADLARSMARVSVPDVIEQPIWFIPGVRNAIADVSLENCEAMDMMRGEEVETAAILARMKLDGPALIIHPGSHSKFVAVDSQNRIAACITTIAGEMLNVLTHQTILAKSVQADFATEIDIAMLTAGAAAARRVGLSRACFSVRILDYFKVCERNARANFLLGAVLSADLQALKNSQAMSLAPHVPVLIAGKPILRQALASLIQGDDFFDGEVTELSDAQQAHLAGFGALCVAKAAGLIVANAVPQISAEAAAAPPLHESNDVKYRT